MYKKFSLVRLPEYERSAQCLKIECDLHLCKSRRDLKGDSFHYCSPWHDSDFFLCQDIRSRTTVNRILFQSGTRDITFSLTDSDVGFSR